jgi:hypothetical protein
VKDRVLRLKFLRAESFIAKQAADRMIRFFDIKLFLFGKDKLCKDITIKDLDYDDMATLEAGFLQLLPVRDRSGRCIFMGLHAHQTYRVAENMVRGYRVYVNRFCFLEGDLVLLQDSVSLVVFYYRPVPCTTS